MTLRIELTELKKNWTKYTGFLLFHIRDSDGGFRVTERELADAAAAVSAQLNAERGTDLDVKDWVHTTKGWSGVLRHAHTTEDGIAWLEAFVATWPQAQGAVVGGPSTRRSLPAPEGTTALTAAVAYTPLDLSLLHDPWPRPHTCPACPHDGIGPGALWYTDPDVTAQLAANALDWVHTPGCVQRYGRDSDWWVEPVDAAYVNSLQANLQPMDWSPADVFAYQRKPTRIRGVSFRGHGQVAFGVLDPARSWSDVLDDVRATMLFSPENITFARVGYAPPTHPSLIWSGCASGTFAHVNESWVRYNEPLWNRLIPDASGTQVLATTHLERAHDLSRWTITEVGADRYLVEAQDVEPWYSANAPDPQALAAARNDFGPMLFSPATVAELGGRVLTSNHGF